jgi:hypothetical protein
MRRPKFCNARRPYLCPPDIGETKRRWKASLRCPAVAHFNQADASAIAPSREKSGAKARR